MTRLSDTQLLILNAAAQRDDGNVLPLPGSLRGGAAAKVVSALLERGLIAERVAETMRTDDPALYPIWRNDADGRAVLLHITEAGLAAIGVAEGDATLEGDPTPNESPAQARSAQQTAHGPANASVAPQGATEGREQGNSLTAADPASKTRKSRDGTKQAQVIAMLRSAEGATIAEIVAATGWQQHTVRGVLAGALKKKLGLDVTSDKIEGRGRVYRIA